MPYSIVRFEKEEVAIGSETRTVFVACVVKQGEEQPYRVVVENFDTPESALAEVNAWIKNQENDDLRAIAEQEREAEAQKNEETLNSLNESLSNQENV